SEPPVPVRNEPAQTLCRICADRSEDGKHNRRRRRRWLATRKCGSKLENAGHDMTSLHSRSFFLRVRRMKQGPRQCQNGGMGMEGATSRHRWKWSNEGR
ncbi:hypothetical protein HaLaN_21066, partial [Haematococcus lacustris]